MIKVIGIGILLLVIGQIQCRSFLYTDNLQKTAYYQCYKQQGFSRVGLSLVYDEEIDEQCTQNFYNALSAGLAVETVIAPFRCRTVQQEIEFMKNKIKLGFVDKFWLLVGADTGCPWTNYTPQENCQYLIELMVKMRGLNLSVGIFTKLDVWVEAFASQTGCPQLNHLPLWWIPLDEEDDNEPNFNTYHQIGGWKTPYMKLLQSVTVCGQNLLQNYYI